MGYKVKVIVMSIIAVVLLVAVAFEVYYFVFKDDTEEIALKN